MDGDVILRGGEGSGDVAAAIAALLLDGPEILDAEGSNGTRGVGSGLFRVVEGVGRLLM
jgi:hypothetical protein